jgi:hypothetical protein
VLLGNKKIGQKYCAQAYKSEKSSIFNYFRKIVIILGIDNSLESFWACWKNSTINIDKKKQLFYLKFLAGIRIEIAF